MMSQPPPPVSGSRQPELYSATIITYGLAVLAVGFRFWSRRLMKARYYIDDWCAATALLMATGLLASTIVWIKQGYGLHFEELGPDFVTNFFKNLFTGEILYTLVICLAKYSILAFYWRIFSVSSIRIPIYILGAMTTAWGISVIFVTIFQCHPISGFWNRTTPSVCVNDFAFFIGIAVPNILTDMALLVLPLPYIWQLNQRASQKTALTGIFLLGGFVIVVSIVRLHTLVTTSTTSPDLDWNFAQVGIWTLTESNIAIVCACLPSLRPILSYVVTGSVLPGQPAKYPTLKFSWWSSKSSLSRAGNDTLGSENDSQRVFVPLSEDANPLYKQSQVVTILAQPQYEAGSNIEMQRTGQNMQGINIQRDTSVMWNN